jgi:hypothetical protein
MGSNLRKYFDMAFILDQYATLEGRLEHYIIDAI